MTEISFPLLFLLKIFLRRNAGLSTVSFLFFLFLLVEKTLVEKIERLRDDELSQAQNTLSIMLDSLQIIARICL